MRAPVTDVAKQASSTQYYWAGLLSSRSSPADDRGLKLHSRSKTKPAMTSSDVIASVSANASEAALLVASLMLFSLDPGMTHRCASAQITASFSTRNAPSTLFAVIKSRSANIDGAKVEQQYGGILARAQPVCAPVMEFSKQRSA
jgi:hypothetical protein